MSARLGWVGVSSVLAVVVALGSSWFVATGQAAAQAAAFPAPVVGVVEIDAEDPASAIVAVYATGQRPSTEVVVEVSSGVSGLPSGSRVSVLFGEPDGERVRVSLVRDGEEVVGLRERGDGSIWTADGSADVGVTEADRALLPLGEIGDATVLWGELALPDADARLTPFFSVGPLLGTESSVGRLTPSAAAGAVGPDGSATGELVQLDSVPSVELLGELVTVSDPAPSPVEIAGVGVTEVRDYLRVVPDFSSSGRTPYFVSIDHATKAVVYWDGTPTLPIPVTAAEGAWLSEPLEVVEGGGYSVSFGRAGLFEVVGADAGSGALGITRVMMLEDGRQLVAEGGVATLEWFEVGDVSAEPVGTTTVTEVTTTEAVEDRSAAAATDDDSSVRGVVLAAAALAMVLGAAAIWAGVRARRNGADSDPADEEEVEEAVDIEDRLRRSTRPPPAEPPLPPGEPGPPRGPGPSVSAPGVEQSTVATRGDRQRRPNEALDALNRLIDDLRLPGED